MPQVVASVVLLSLAEQASLAQALPELQVGQTGGDAVPLSGDIPQPLCFERHISAMSSPPRKDDGRRPWMLCAENIECVRRGFLRLTATEQRLD